MQETGLALAALLLTAPGVFGQEAASFVGAGVGVTIEPDESIYGRVLSGPLSGSATAVTAWTGRHLDRRSRLIGEFTLAREFQDLSFLSAQFPGTSVYRRHRDLTLLAVLQINPLPAARLSAGPALWLSAGIGMIQVRVRQADAEGRRLADGRLEATRVGARRTRFLDWQPAAAFGADGAVPLADRLRVVPSFRLHIFHHDPGTDVSTFGLAPYTVRFTIGAEVGL